MKTIVKFYSPIVTLSLILSLTAYYLRVSYGFESLIQDISGIGLLIGVIGTVYTLVSAFVIAEVWSQFNSMGEMLSTESKAISSLWNFTNYFNDKKLTISMQTVLDKYLAKVIEVEIGQASKLIRSNHPSKELNDIHKVIDSLNFDDKRDGSVYPSFIDAFEDLSSIRAKRIDASVSRVPIFLKSLMILLSVLLVSSFLLLGFYNPFLYVFTVFGVTLVTLVIFKVVSDLDDPFNGIWNLELSMLEQARKYLKSSQG